MYIANMCIAMAHHISYADPNQFRFKGLGLIKNPLSLTTPLVVSYN